MSAILSASDLNDFITPGVACIKPVETLPKQQPSLSSTASSPRNTSNTTTDPNPYEVTTEDAPNAPHSDNAPAPASISLTDCLACSGCVTSAEAVLVSLQSQEEVLSTLDKHPSLSIDDTCATASWSGDTSDDGRRLFVASVSPQARASLAATYEILEGQAGCMVEQLLSGEKGLRSGGRYGSGFTWVVDTNVVREVSHCAGAQEVVECVERTQSKTDTHAQQNGFATSNGKGHDRSRDAFETPVQGHTKTPNNYLHGQPRPPVLASACPGWICYVEKTHPHVLPHISRLKSPQALAGTLLKSILCRRFNVRPDRIWHLAVMPCFDKKLEASREELTDVYWRDGETGKKGVRDVDCVITARELLMLAESRGISFPALPRVPVENLPSFPDLMTDRFLFPRGRRRTSKQLPVAGPSGGYAYSVLQRLQSRTPGSVLEVQRGRNPDLIEYVLSVEGRVVTKTARYFGFQNIQNLVRKLKPPEKSRLPGSRQRTKTQEPMAAYAYVEVMACPGGCTNGGGQIKVDDLPAREGVKKQERKAGPAEQKQWLARVDEAYYSADSSSSSSCEGEDDSNDVDGYDAMDIDAVDDMKHENTDTERRVEEFLRHWSSITNIAIDKLLYTSYRQVESDVGKKSGNASSDMERVAGLASSIGGGW